MICPLGSARFPYGVRLTGLCWRPQWHSHPARFVSLLDALGVTVNVGSLFVVGTFPLNGGEPSWVLELVEVVASGEDRVIDWGICRFSGGFWFPCHDA